MGGLFFFLLLFLFVFVFFFFISLMLSSFSDASSLGRWLEILKYCGLDRCNPKVVVVTTGGVLAKYWLTA